MRGESCTEVSGLISRRKASRLSFSVRVSDMKGVRTLVARDRQSSGEAAAEKAAEGRVVERYSEVGREHRGFVCCPGCVERQTCGVGLGDYCQHGVLGEPQGRRSLCAALNLNES